MSDPVAGPSSKTAQHALAPEHPLPSDHYYAIDFPGIVNDGSVDRAIEHLGGQPAIERVFRRNASRVDQLLELNWRPGNAFAHPVPGGIIHANNLLLKVTKRKRKRRDGEELSVPEGEFVAEVVGVVPKTVRFRSMADFQYSPEASDPVVQFRSAMDRMDVEHIRNYVIPPEKEDYELPADDMEGVELDQAGPSAPKNRSNLRLIPPPVFTRQMLPQIYNYKANPMSLVTTYIDSETGEERQRLINKARWKGYGPASISFSDKSTVPTAPPDVNVKAVDDSDKRIIELLKQKFEERPCYTKVAIANQFGPKEARQLNSSKHLLPLVSYVFADGPWRDTHIRFGYDPRTDPSSRFYQRLYFRNVNHPNLRQSILLGGRQEARVPERQDCLTPQNDSSSAEEPPSHIFDGVHLTKETAAFQLCDITDPMLKQMIEDGAVRDECNERDGWYTAEALERIKAVLRHKFFSLLEGHIPTDEECRSLLDGNREAFHSRTFKPSKHNMAKGALRPEDAAAMRLRSKLDTATKGILNKNRR